MLEENRASVLQEWHGLTVGLKWIVPTTGDPYHRPVKDKPAAQLGVCVTHIVKWCETPKQVQLIELE